MVKKYIWIILVWTVQIATAQNHISFLDIPIEGKPADFAKKLEEKGWKPCRPKMHFNNMDVVAYRGSFWAFEDCTLYIRNIQGKDTVTSVYIHPHRQFRLLNELIDSFDEKYSIHKEEISRTDKNDIIPHGQLKVELFKY